MCRRRLRREHTGDKRSANASASARFAVSNRVSADARLAHAELGPPSADAFVDPRDLEPEQRALYRAAVQGYLGEFGDRPGRAVDLGWQTHLDDIDVDLVADPGIALDLPDGRRELRVLLFGARSRGASLLDAVNRRVALVRTAEWAPDQLTIVTVDLIELSGAQSGAAGQHHLVYNTTLSSSPPGVSASEQLTSDQATASQGGRLTLSYEGHTLSDESARSGAEVKFDGNLYAQMIFPATINDPTQYLRPDGTPLAQQEIVDLNTLIDRAVVANFFWIALAWP